VTDEHPSDIGGAAANAEQIEPLVRQLAGAAAALQTLTAGQVDAVVDPASGLPFLLYQAQAALRGAHDELEERVRERTAALARANEALRTEAAERKRAAAALQRYADRLQSLHQMDQAILAAQSAGDIARIALAHLRQMVPCKRASVALFDRVRDEMSLLAIDAEGGTSLGEGWSGPIGPGQAIQGLLEGEVLVVEDLAAASPPSPFAQTLVAEGIQAIASVPLHSQVGLIGSLNLGMSHRGPLSPEQIDVVREVADQLAVGIRQAQLHAEVLSYAEVLEQRVARRTAHLQATAARIRAIFEGAGIGIAVVDLEGRISESNPALQQMLGYEGEALRGRPVASFLPPEDVAAETQAYQALLAGQREERHEGREFRYLTRNGQERWASATVSLVRDASGRPQFAIAMMQDVTAQKEAVEGLIRSEKMATTGRLAASLAHEINNPLQSVVGCLGLAQQRLAGQEDVARLLDIARQEVRRVTETVARLRDIGRPSRPEGRVPTDLNAVLREVLTLTRQRCEQGHVQVLWNATQGLPPLVVVADRIQQVFLHLVLNAVEAMPKGGQLRISTVRSEEPAGMQVTLADTGEGIPPETLPLVFDPFYTTRTLNLGLGLYVSRNIVEAHGGHIDVESRPGEGTAVRVWLPLRSR
jgi:PAS domain S-box-containing protein